MTTYRMQIAWPESALSSNARAHWSKVARAKKAARETAFWEAKSMGLPKLPNATLRFTYHPPDNRKRDAQNMPHMLKATIDGIADARGCDDHNFACVFPSRFAEVRRGGRIIIEIGGQA